MIISLINMEYNDCIKENIYNIREELIKKYNNTQSNSIKEQLIVITTLLETLEIELINLIDLPDNENSSFNLLELKKDNKVINDLIPIAILYRYMLGV